MKPSLMLLTLISLFVLPGSSFAAKPPRADRTLADLNVIPTRVLKRSVSPKFFRTLLVSPIQGWIVVRGNLSGAHLSGMRLVHSELNGSYDALALKLASEVQIAGNYTLDRPNVCGSVLVHLLIYQTADGTMVLSFPHLDGAGGDQMAYFGCARLTVLKSNGNWTEIEGPEGLQGKGWAVRAAGLENNLRAILKLERIPGG
jgi:hypothetical protein